MDTDGCPTEEVLFSTTKHTTRMPEIAMPPVKRARPGRNKLVKKGSREVKKQESKSLPARFEITDKFSIVIVDQRQKAPKRAKNTIDIDCDNWFLYPSLRRYYGPSSIIDLLRFKDIVKGSPANSKIRLIASGASSKRTNATFLVGAYLVWWGGLSAEHACSLVRTAAERMPMYQTEGLDPYPDTITVGDCIRAVERFRDLGLVDPGSLDADQISFYEDPDNGDMNWIVPDKFLAFAGPDHANLDDFIAYAIEHNIQAVVRLNEHEYEPLRLEAAGIGHLDIPMVDGSVPTLQQIVQFRSYVEPIFKAGGAVAVHCRAGLGRTGTMIGTYLVREYGLPVPQMIAWARIMRPGSFLTKQPRFMEAIQWWLRDEIPTEAEEAFIKRTLGEDLASQLKIPYQNTKC